MSGAAAVRILMLCVYDCSDPAAAEESRSVACAAAAAACTAAAAAVGGYPGEDKPTDSGVGLCCWVSVCIIFTIVGISFCVCCILGGGRRVGGVRKAGSSPMRSGNKSNCVQVAAAASGCKKLMSDGVVSTGEPRRHRVGDRCDSASACASPAMCSVPLRNGLRSGAPPGLAQHRQD
jgi:hypothetical protein